ncbi:hypothetical protein IGK74_002449 [Enterococcus sp. AZ150]|uniref:hypothetical protein n=1 Tax=Enterococcus sp. AZ150 TaxID=2774866 RepID=UPI003F1EC555
MQNKYYIMRVVGKKNLFLVRVIKKLMNTAVVKVYSLKKEYLFIGLVLLKDLNKKIYLSKNSDTKYYIKKIYSLF